MYKAKIISNLEICAHKWVNPFVALNGLMDEGYCDDVRSPHDDLKELVQDGIVEKSTILLGHDKSRRPLRADLYRYSPSLGSKGKKLTPVK